MTEVAEITEVPELTEAVEARLKTYPPLVFEGEVTRLREQLARKFHDATELKPNAIHFHSIGELRDRLGIGRLLKEEKVADHRSTPKPAPPSRPTEVKMPFAVQTSVT